MARVFQDGFEFNSVTANPATYDTISGSPTISSTTFRSGAYAGRVSSLSSGAAKGWVKKWISSGADGPYWGRVYLNVATRPSSTNHIMSFNSASSTAGTSERIKITLEADGTLILRQADGTAIGSASAVLSLNTWYMVELKFDRTPAAGSEVAEARLNESVFATTSSLTYAGAALAFSVGGNLDLEAQTTGDWFFDDIAVNDNTGSFQNSYPGSGKIIHLRPNATGDANGFLVNVGGTAGAANNFTRVNEVTPDDATTYNASAVLNAEDLFNVDASGIGASDTVNVVMVGGRFANTVAADATTAIKFEIIKTSGGTKSQSAAIIPNSTSWNTNGTASPRNYPIVLYQDPDSSAWTQATLDTMQIGYLESAANVQSAAVTNIWASVEFVPSIDTTVNVSDTATTSESIGRMLESYINKSDTATITESVGITLVHNINVSDTATVSESIGKLLESYINVSDSSSISENRSLLIPELLVNLNDSSTISESIIRLLTSFTNTSDNLTIAESANISLVPTINVSDTAALTESTKTELESNINKSDTATVSENISLLIPTLNVAVSDSATISESITIQETISINVSDTITVSESILNGGVPNVNVSDNISISEVSSVVFQGGVAVFDSVAVSESVSVALSNPQINVSDNLTLAESINRLLISSINVLDSTTITEHIEIFTIPPPQIGQGDSLDEITAVNGTAVSNQTGSDSGEDSLGTPAQSNGDSLDQVTSVNGSSVSGADDSMEGIASNNGTPEASGNDSSDSSGSGIAQSADNDSAP